MLQMLLETLRRYRAHQLTRSEALLILTDIEGAALDMSLYSTLQSRSTHYANLATDAVMAQGELL